MMPHTPHGAATGALARVALASDVTAHSGQCQRPVFMVGHSLLVEAATGRIVHRNDSGDGQSIMVRCRNRRASVCKACSALYRLDAYHLIAAGLRGGKNTPQQVADRPRLFLTLTAPSFGRVHLGPDGKGLPRPCHPNGKAGNGCGRWHPAGDPLIGTPVDPGSYDYPGQVLFNAHAGMLWSRLTIEARRALARSVGLSRKDAHGQVRVVFAKVAEFQARGCVHYHAVVRLDGPDGPASLPPFWATVERLEGAIREAASAVTLTSPGTASVAARNLTWGRQLDIQYLPSGDPGSSDIAIARYVAKYATKAAEITGVTVPALFCLSCGGDGTRTTGDGETWLCQPCSGTGRRPYVGLSQLNEHGRALVDTCWWLGGLPAFKELRLRRWAHQVGYRGHFTTKSRSYSTTFAALRDERREWNTAQLLQSLGIDPNAGRLISVSDWRYAGDAADRLPDGPGER